MASREQDYTVPYNYENLDELAAPSPVDDTPEHRQQGLFEERLLDATHADRSDDIGHQRKGDGQPAVNVAHDDNTEKVDYTIPDEYANIDELNTPYIVENPHGQRPQGYLEDRHSYSNDPKGRQTHESTGNGVPTEAKSSSQNDRRTGICTQAESSTSPPSSQSKLGSGTEKKRSEHERASKFATQLYTTSYLIFFSILGTLARLGLQALTFYPGAPVQTGVLWANFGGSLMMGFLSEDRNLFHHEDWDVTASSKQEKRSDEENGSSDKNLSRPQPRTPSANRQHAAVKKTIPLYIGLATGFCGSFTSFSSFIRDAFLALSDALPVPVSHPTRAPISPYSTIHRNGGYSFMAVLAVLITTVFLSLGALQFGAHLAIALEHYTPSIPYRPARKILDRMMVAVAWVSWLGAIFMAIWPADRPGGPAGRPTWAQEMWRGDAIFALVFAPLGCLLRFHASLHLNGKLRSFPLGTFAVNMFGAAMEGMFYDLQHVPLGARIGCQVLQGAMDGFCGCLTTVSTWVAELKGLRMKHAYMYGSVSIGTGLGLMTVIMGSLQWTQGFESPPCTG